MARNTAYDVELIDSSDEEEELLRMIHPPLNINFALHEEDNSNVLYTV